MPSSSTVQVLLSAHNGDRYIATQLATILSQSHKDLCVLVRADGSTDRTVEIVKTIAAGDPRVRLVEGPWLGWAASFMELLASGGEARWYAFSDQDDVWLPDKLARAVAALEPLDDRPALYASAILHVTKSLRSISASSLPRRMSLENALVQNVLPGCTMVLNRAARTLCLESGARRPVYDWWLYLVIIAFGTVIFDDAITMLHRVHDDNATPVPLWGHWLRRMTAHLKLPSERRPRAIIGHFYETFGHRLNPDQRAMVEDVLSMDRVSWLSRARYAWRTPLFRQTALDNAIFRVLLALGRI